MKVTVKITDSFKKEAKPLLKKHKSLTSDLKNLEKDLLLDPALGTPLGNNTFKIRLKIASKGKGKSGGARVITCAKVVQDKVFLLKLYDKSEKETVDDKELQILLEATGLL